AEYDHHRPRGVDRFRDRHLGPDQEGEVSSGTALPCALACAREECGEALPRSGMLRFFHAPLEEEITPVSRLRTGRCHGTVHHSCGDTTRAVHDHVLTSYRIASWGNDRPARGLVAAKRS